MIIDMSELTDFKTILAKHGLSDGDFVLSSKEDPLPVGDSFAGKWQCHREIREDGC